jgi:hypothetical protein
MTKTPIILGFEPGESLTTLTSIVVGGGIAWGQATLPFTPLVFSPQNIAEVMGPNFLQRQYGGSVDNKTFYDNHYSGLPLLYQRKFWGPKQVVVKSVKGVGAGLSGGGAIAAAGKALEAAAAKRLVGKIFHKFFSTVGLDVVQSGTSLNATLYGINGHDTYNLDMALFNQTANICLLQGGISAVAQAGLNLLIIGNFASNFGRLGAYDYLVNVWGHAEAVAVVADAALGFILPGAQVFTICS